MSTFTNTEKLKVTEKGSIVINFKNHSGLEINLKESGAINELNVFSKDSAFYNLVSINVNKLNLQEKENLKNFCKLIIGGIDIDINELKQKLGNYE